jgi:hypothetical protein
MSSQQSDPTETDDVTKSRQEAWLLELEHVAKLKHLKESERLRELEEWQSRELINQQQSHENALAYWTYVPVSVGGSGTNEEDVEWVPSYHVRTEKIIVLL